MADVSISANCGCGYKTNRLEEAERHSDSTLHKMTILGTVVPTTAPTTLPSTVLSVETERTVSAEKQPTIAELRAKINGRR